MKILSFSAVEILPALLDKTKTQTIRPLFCDDQYCLGNDKIKGLQKRMHEHKPRFKVGEKVKLMWKQRSKYEAFCSIGGEPILESNQDWHAKNCIPKGEARVIEKLLGTGTITEVFEIEMWIGNDAPLVKGYRLQDTYELARRDGFLAGDNGKYRGFYEFFMKYKLDPPKRFAVYRWKWD